MFARNGRSVFPILENNDKSVRIAVPVKLHQGRWSRKLDHLRQLVEGKDKSWISKRLLLILSLIGFAYQTSLVSEEYFRYETTTAIKFVKPNFVKHHTIALCLRYADLLDTKRLFNETGMRYQPPEWKTGSPEISGTRLRVDQIFEYTPAPDQVIESCFNRPKDWQIRNAKSAECNIIFNVTKFFTLEFMCYKIQDELKRKVHLTAVIESEFNALKIFEMTLKKRFADAFLAYPIAYRGTYPFVSREHAHPVPPLKSRPRSNESVINTLYVSPRDMRIQRLPPPYNTRCIPRNGDDPYICMRQCLTKKYTQVLNRVPGTELLRSRYKLKPLSYEDLQNSSIRKGAQKLRQECEKNCIFTACVVGYTVTHTVTSLRTDASFTLTSLVSLEADARIQTQPQMSAIDYFSFICTSFGWWFGLSFLSLDPVRLLPHKRHRPHFARVMPRSS